MSDWDFHLYLVFDIHRQIYAINCKYIWKAYRIFKEDTLRISSLLNIEMEELNMDELYEITFLPQKTGIEKKHDFSTVLLLNQESIQEEFENILQNKTVGIVADYVRQLLQIAPDDQYIHPPEKDKNMFEPFVKGYADVTVPGKATVTVKILDMKKILESGVIKPYKVQN